MNNTFQNKLFLHELFDGTDRRKLEEIAANCGVCTKCFQKGECVFSDGEGSPSMIFVVKGMAAVRSHNENADVLIKNISEGEIFGVANLFSTCPEPPTRIIAATSLELLLIPKETVCEMLAADNAFTMNYIRFLSDKICFLNKKITFFTSPDAECRLANYLYSLCDGNSEVELSVPLSSLAKMLDIGRASLYRSFERLAADGIIVKDGKKIIIKSKEKLINKQNEVKP